MQTLEVLPSVSNPPTLDESNTLMKDVQAIVNLNNRQVLALRVWAKVYQLAINGGTDYKTDIPLLIQSALNLLGNAWNVIDDPWAGRQSGRIEAVLDWSAGYTATNTLSTDVETLVSETRLIAQYPESTIYRCLLFLKYKLAE